MTPASPVSSARREPLLVVLALLTALAPFSMDIYTPSLPRIQNDLGGSDSAVQTSITACLLGIAVGQLLLGPLSDRVGRRPVILGGVIGWTLASVASAAAPSILALILFRGFAGLLGAAGIVVARSIVRDFSDSPRLVGGRIALLATVSAVAPIVAPTVGAAVAAAWGWRADFVALTILGILVTIAVALVVPETLHRASRHLSTPVLRSLSTALKDAELRNIALSLAVQAIGFYAYIATASFVVEREFGFSAAAFALVFGTNAAIVCAANLVFRRLVRRQHPRVLLGFGLVIVLLGGGMLAVAAGFQTAPGVLWGASIVFAAGMGFVLPGAHSWGQLTSQPSGAASALTGAAQFLGGVVGSPLTGLIAPNALVLGLIVAATAAGSLAVWRLAMRAHRLTTITA
jgi:DHA1 family bicyclomycin/chloramphenicol resistance-like MFS transporter